MVGHTHKQIRDWSTNWDLNIEIRCLSCASRSSNLYFAGKLTFNIFLFIRRREDPINFLRNTKFYTAYFAIIQETVTQNVEGRKRMHYSRRDIRCKLWKKLYQRQIFWKSKFVFSYVIFLYFTSSSTS